MRPEIPDALAERIEAVYERGGYSTPSALVRDATRKRVALIEREGEQPPLVGLSDTDADPDAETTSDGGERVTRPPFKDRRGEGDGIVYGHNPFNDEPVRADRFGQLRGGNTLVLGSVGSGKSVSTNVQLKRELEAHDDLRVIYIDIHGSAAPLAETMESQEVSLGDRVGINPLEVMERSEIDGRTPHHEKAPCATAFVKQLPRGEYLVDNEVTIRVLQQAVKQALPRVAASPQPDVTLADVRVVIEDIAESPSDHTLGIEQNKEHEASIAEEAVQLLHRTAPLAVGGDESLRTFSRPTTFDIEDSRVTWLNFKDSSEAVRDAAMIAATETAFEQACASSDRVIIALDEFEHVVRTDYGDELPSRIKQGRVHDVGWHFVGQTIRDEEVSGDGGQVLKHFDIKHLHRMGTGSTAVSALDLTEDEREYVEGARPGGMSGGNDGMEGSETLLMIGDKRIPTVVEAPDELMTDKY